MAILPPLLSRLAASYENLLFEGELRERVSHHLAHVAPETWLAMELALLINSKGGDFGMPGWSALIERKRVDVTLIPPGYNPLAELPPEAVYLELKLVGTDWWNTVWRDVQRDLGGEIPGKPKASYAICFLINSVGQSTFARRRDTEDRYASFVSRVPIAPGRFEPLPGEPELLLVHSSSVYRVEWTRPVPGRWPNGYRADVRVLWLQASTCIDAA